MSAADEAVVRRFYDEMCNGRHNEIAGDLFTDDHLLHDPQVPAGPGPAGVVEAVATYQQSLDGHWEIEEMFSAGDRVVVRWTGSGTHVGDMNGIPPTGRAVEVGAVSVHRMADGRIAETHEVWDALGLLQQLGAVPGAASADEAAETPTQLLRNGYDAFARGDIEAVLRLFDPDITWTTPATMPLGGTYRGPAEVAEFFAKLPELFAELTVQPDQYVEAGDTVTVLGRLVGRTQAGVAFEEPIVHVWTVRNGRSVAFQEFTDTARMNSILGVAAAAADVGVPGQARRAESASESRA